MRMADHAAQNAETSFHNATAPLQLNIHHFGRNLALKVKHKITKESRNYLCLRGQIRNEMESEVYHSEGREWQVSIRWP
jgi:hypothetical protein